MATFDSRGAAAHRRRVRTAAARIARRPVIDALEPRRLLSAVSWVGTASGGDGTNWTDPKNWSTGALPGPADDVTINVGGNPSIKLAFGAQSIHSLTDSNTLIISGALLLGAASKVNASLTLSGGSINGSGPLWLTGLFTWLGGNLVIPTTTAAGGIDFHGQNNDYLWDGTLILPAGQTATIGATGNSTLQMVASAVFDNGGTLIASGGASLESGAGGPLIPTFKNSGTLNVDSTTTFTISSGLIFSNTGTVNVQAGTLTIGAADAGATTGSFNVSAGATLNFGSTSTDTLIAPGTISGAGTVQFSQCMITFVGSYDISANATFAFGTLAGTGSLTFDKLLTWDGGILSESSTTAGSGIDFRGQNNDYLIGATLTLPSGETATLGASGGSVLNMQNAATFNNDGTVNISGNGGLGGFGGSTFNNNGTLNLSPTTFSGFGADLKSTGTINVESGTLQLHRPGIIYGSVNISAGATLECGYGADQIGFSTPGTMSGPGTVLLDDLATVGFLGNYDISANVTLEGASVIGAGTFDHLLKWSGGTLAAGSTFTAANGIDFEGQNTDYLGGTLVLPAGQTATFGASSSSTLQMSYGVFNNDGTINASGTVSMQMSNGAVLNNDGTINASGAFFIQKGGGTGMSMLNNVGKLNVSTLTTFTVGAGLGFDNTGTVNVQAGTMALDATDGGSTPGSFNVSQGASLYFGPFAMFSFAPPGSLSGAGAVQFDMQQGTVNFSSGYNISLTSTVRFSSGIVTFSGTEDVGTSITLAGAIFEGPAATLILDKPFIWSGGILALHHTISNGGIAFQGLTNDLSSGTLTLAAGQTGTFGPFNFSCALQIGKGAVFDNAGTLSMDSVSEITNAGGNPSTFNNSGILNVDQNTGIDSAFNNTGIVNVQSGATMALSGSDTGATSGTFNISAGGMLDFGEELDLLGSSNYTLVSPGTITGDGTVEFNTIQVTFVGSYDIGANAVVASNMSGAGALTFDKHLTWGFGNLSFPSITAAGGVDFQQAYLGSGTLTVPAGQISTLGAIANSSLQMAGGAVLNNAGVLNVTGTATIKYSGGAMPAFNNTGTLNLNSPTTLTIGAGLIFNNTGTVNVQAGTLALNATLAQYAPATGTLTGGTWIIGAGGTLNLPTADIIYQNEARVTLDGAGSTFAAINSLAANTGTFVLADGRSFAASPAGGTFTNSATISLGLSSALAVSGAFMQTSTGTMVSQMSGTGVGQITATGAVMLAGTYTPMLASPYDPPLGTVVTPVTSASRSGTFTAVGQLVTPSGRLLNVHYTDTSVVVEVGPVAPSAPKLAPGSDSGVSNSDGITNVVTPTIVGTAAEGTSIAVFVDGTQVGTVPIVSGGWTFVSPHLADGVHSIAAVAQDADGDLSLPSAALSVIIDTVAPTVINAVYTYTTLPHSVSITFSKNVSPTLSLHSAQVQNLTTGTPVAPVSSAYDQATNTVVFKFAGQLPDGNYRLTLSGVTDLAGNVLVGNAAGSYTFDFFFLTGDLNHDRSVNFTDLVTLARNYGQAATYTQGDLDYDGKVDFADLVIVATHYGHTLPGPQTAASSLAPAVADPGPIDAFLSPTGPKPRSRPRARAGL